MTILTFSWILDVIILLVSLFGAAYLYMTRKFKYWKKKGIKEIKPTPFVGNIGSCVLMKQSPGICFQKIYEDCKGLPYAGIYLFDKPALLLRDPNLIKQILIKDFNYFNDRFTRGSAKDKVGNSNLFMIKNPDWKVLRTKLTPIFTSGKLKKMFQLMVEVGKDLDTLLATEVPPGTVRTLEMKEVCARFTTDMIGTTAYGLKVNCLNNPDAEFRKCGKKIFTYDIRRSIEFTSILFLPEIVGPLGFEVFAKESTCFLRNIFWETTNARIKSGIKRNDLIDLLIELKESTKNDSDKSKDFQFDGDNLVAQAAIFFTGGFETSSTTMSFTLYHLAVNPDVQNKLRAEITEALKSNGGKVTYDMVTVLPYLDMVISENLRLIPVLPYLDRMASVNYKLDEGLTVDKGTPIVIPMLGLHKDPKYFPNPEAFDPERFSPQNKKSLPSCVYMPFGEGPRVCIGERLGLMQSKLGLIHIISQYEIFVDEEKTPVPIQIDPKAFLTSPIGGIYLKLKKITTAAG